MKSIGLVPPPTEKGGQIASSYQYVEPPTPLSPGAKRKFVDDNFFIPDSIKTFVSDKMQSFGCSAHDIDHAYRVANLSKTIAEYEENADVRMAYICGLTHDLLDSKFSSSGEIDEFELEFLRLIKDEEGFLTDKEMDTLFTVIKSIGYKKLIQEGWDASSLPPEYFCVQDADLLDAIGAIGVSRCFSFGGKRNRKLFGVTCEVRPPGVNISSADYIQAQKNEEASNIDHFFEKLLTIQSRMQTAHGRVLAAKRHDFMIEYLKQLDEELGDAKESKPGDVSRPAQLFARDVISAAAAVDDNVPVQRGSSGGSNH